MERSFGLFFFLRKSKSGSDSEIPIYMRITVDGTSTEISTKRKCPTHQWSRDAGRMAGKSEEAKQLNAYLDTLQQKVFEAKRQILELDKPLTCDTIKDRLLGREAPKKKRMIMEIFYEHNQQMNALVGRDYAPGTMQRFETSYRHTLAFIQTKYRVPDKEIEKLDYEFLRDYEFWLKSVRKCDHNSTIKYLSNFRKIVNRCLRSGWLQRDPFFGFPMNKREVHRTALTEKELDVLISKQFSLPRLELVRDIFLFSCFCGLAYIDVHKLKRSEIVIGVDGEQWISCTRQKTHIPSRIPLLPVALKILDKYKDHPDVLSKDRVLPVLINQKMNAYLKEIADMCGIDKTLTYHIARHTFATTITLSNGVPIETVAKMLGHRNLRTTQHYAKILDHKIANDKVISLGLVYSENSDVYSFLRNTCSTCNDQGFKEMFLKNVKLGNTSFDGYIIGVRDRKNRQVGHFFGVKRFGNLYLVCQYNFSDITGFETYKEYFKGLSVQ